MSDIREMLAKAIEGAMEVTAREPYTPGSLLGATAADGIGQLLQPPRAVITSVNTGEIADAILAQFELSEKKPRWIVEHGHECDGSCHQWAVGVPGDSDDAYAALFIKEERAQEYAAFLNEKEKP